VSSDCQKESKLLRGLSTRGLKLNFPPNNCMPSRAKITMKRNNSSSRLTMDLILLSNEATRFRKDVQYLHRKYPTVRTDRLYFRFPVAVPLVTI